MPADTLDCIFSCTQCEIRDLHVYVPVRKEKQDIKEWMEKVCIPAVSEAHNRMSPRCHPKTLTNLKIPMSEKGVGFQLTGNEKFSEGD
jgi:homoaconitase/3-isopropylmalate dehydratase large subunit